MGGRSAAGSTFVLFDPWTSAPCLCPLLGVGTSERGLGGEWDGGGVDSCTRKAATLNQPLRYRSRAWEEISFPYNGTKIWPWMPNWLGTRPRACGGRGAWGWGSRPISWCPLLFCTLLSRGISILAWDRGASKPPRPTRGVWVVGLRGLASLLALLVGLNSRGSMRSDGPGTGFAPREGPKSVRIPQHLGGSSVFYTMGFLERPLKSKGSNTLGDFFEDTPFSLGGRAGGGGNFASSVPL